MLRETVLQCALVLAKSGRPELGDNIYVHYRSIFHHYDIIGLQSYRIRRETQNKGYYAMFKIIQRHRVRYQSKARMRLPISD